MSRLLGSNKLNESMILSLLESNLKFLINIDLYQASSHPQEYSLWLKRIKDIIINVITKSLIHIDNQLISESI